MKPLNGPFRVQKRAFLYTRARLTDNWLIINQWDPELYNTGVTGMATALINAREPEHVNNWVYSSRAVFLYPFIGYPAPSALIRSSLSNAGEKWFLLKNLSKIGGCGRPTAVLVILYVWQESRHGSPQDVNRLDLLTALRELEIGTA